MSRFLVGYPCACGASAGEDRVSERVIRSRPGKYSLGSWCYRRYLDHARNVRGRSAVLFERRAVAAYHARPPRNFGCEASSAVGGTNVVVGGSVRGCKKWESVVDDVDSTERGRSV